MLRYDLVHNLLKLAATETVLVFFFFGDFFCHSTGFSNNNNACNTMITFVKVTFLLVAFWLRIVKLAKLLLGRLYDDHNHSEIIIGKKLILAVGFPEKSRLHIKTRH